VLTGSRTAAFERQLDTAIQDGLVELLRVPNKHPPRDIPLPISLFIQFDNEDGLTEWAKGLDVRYMSCFALQGAKLLPQLRLEARVSAPEFGKPLEYYDLDRCEYQWVKRPQRDGLYRLKQREGKRVCQVLHDGSWYTTSHEEGVYAALRARNTDADVLRWLTEQDCGRDQFGTLYVDWGYPLPDLHRRVAAMCSGLAPRINELAENLAYDNVPKAVAIKIAESLGQRLRESNE
jgi:hypothetical protein